MQIYQTNISAANSLILMTAVRLDIGLAIVLDGGGGESAEWESD